MTMGNDPDNGSEKIEVSLGSFRGTMTYALSGEIFHFGRTTIWPQRLGGGRFRNPSDCIRWLSPYRDRRIYCGVRYTYERVRHEINGISSGDKLVRGGVISGPRAGNGRLAKINNNIWIFTASRVHGGSVTLTYKYYVITFTLASLSAGIGGTVPPGPVAPVATRPNAEINFTHVSTMISTYLVSAAIREWFKLPDENRFEQSKPVTGEC